jgi:hypothetical protein
VASPVEILLGRLDFVVQVYVCGIFVASGLVDEGDDNFGQQCLVIRRDDLVVLYELRLDLNIQSFSEGVPCGLKDGLGYDPVWLEPPLALEGLESVDDFGLRFVALLFHDGLESR